MLGKSTTLSIFALSSHIFPQPWGNATKITWLTSHPLAKKHRKMTWQSCWDVDKNPILGAILLSTYIKIDDRSSQVSSHWEPKRIDWCCKRIESAGRFYWWPLCSKKTLENETFVFQVVWKKIAMSLQKHNKLQRKKWHGMYVVGHFLDVQADLPVASLMAWTASWKGKTVETG